MNNNLHPRAFRHLITLFCDPKVNKKGAQLIFTSHETSVLDDECMHRDQIWVVDKGDDLASVLTPLSDFKERDLKGFQKYYLDGRFGGVPRLAG